MRNRLNAGADAGSSVDVIVPVSFNFPNAGKLLQLVFVLFAAWFSNTAISLAGYVNLAFSGLFSLFGKPVAAMPFLLDLLHLPGDIFQFYLASGIFVAQLGTMGSAMHLFALAVLGGFVMAGALRLQWKRLVPVTALALGVVAATVVGARAYFSFAVGNTYDKAKLLALMQPLFPAGPAKVYKSPPPFAGAIAAIRIEKDPRAEALIRVGYLGDRRPFAFFNEQGNLVGLDIEMAQVLARSARCGRRVRAGANAPTMFEQLERRLLRYRDVGNRPDARSNGNRALFSAVPGRESGLRGPGLPSGGIRQ